MINFVILSSVLRITSCPESLEVLIILVLSCIGLNQTSIRMEYGSEPDSELHLRTGIDMHRLEMPMGGGGGGELSLGPGGVSGQAPSGGGVRNQR